VGLWVPGDPGGEQVVGVLRKVVSHEYVEQVGVAAEMGVGEGDQLAVPGRGGVAGGRQQDSAIPRHEGGCDQQARGGGGTGAIEDLSRGVGMPTDQATEEGGVVIRHRTTVTPGADDALTTADDG